jgi:hypothetical protein
MAQVIFINHTYWPGYEEILRRSKLQDHINGIHAMIRNESKGIKFNEVVFKKRFLDEMRGSWVLIHRKTEPEQVHHLLSGMPFR